MEGSGGATHEEWEELEPQRIWTPADRWRMATWVLIVLNILGVLLLAPIGDGLLAHAAEAAGADDGPARLTFWISLIACAIIGNAIGAAAAATRQRWAIVAPLLAAAGSWIGFLVASSLV